MDACAIVHCKRKKAKLHGRPYCENCRQFLKQYVQEYATEKGTHPAFAQDDFVAWLEAKWVCSAGPGGLTACGLEGCRLCRSRLRFHELWPFTQSILSTFEKKRYQDSLKNTRFAARAHPYRRPTTVHANEPTVLQIDDLTAEDTYRDVQMLQAMSFESPSPSSSSEGAGTVPVIVSAVPPAASSSSASSSGSASPPYLDMPAVAADEVPPLWVEQRPNPSGAPGISELQDLGAKLTLWIQTRQSPGEVQHLMHLLQVTQRDCESKLATMQQGGAGITDMRVLRIGASQPALFQDPFCVTQSLSILQDDFNAYLLNESPIDFAPTLPVGTYHGSIHGRMVVVPINESVTPAVAFAQLQDHLRHMNPQHFDSIFRGLTVEQSSVVVRELTELETEFMESSLQAQKRFVTELLETAQTRKKQLQDANYLDEDENVTNVGYLEIVDGKLEFIKEPRPDHVTTSRRSFKRRHKTFQQSQQLFTEQKKRRTWRGVLARVIAFCALFGAIFGLMALLRFTIGDSIALNITAMVVFMGVCFAIVGGVGCAVAACCRRRAISRQQWFKVQVEDEKMLLDHSDQDADDVPLIDNVLFSDFQKSLILMQSATIV